MMFWKAASSGFAPQRMGFVVGKGVADTLGARLDDSIVIASSTGGKTTARIVGIFRTGVTPVDYSRGYMLLSSAQTLLDKKNIVNEIVLRTTDYTKAREYAEQIEGACGYRTESWQESNANFLKIFNIQAVITYIITGALLVVAAFGVLNILIMAVLERVNDIAILRSFGLSRWDVGVIYTMQGIVIGIVGASIGLVMGKLTIEGLRRIPVTLEGLIRTEGLLMSEHASQYYMAFGGRSDRGDVRIRCIRRGVRPSMIRLRSFVAHTDFPLDPSEALLLRAQNVHRILGSGDTANPVLRGVTLEIAPAGVRVDRRGERIGQEHAAVPVWWARSAIASRSGWQDL